MDGQIRTWKERELARGTHQLEGTDGQTMSEHGKKASQNQYDVPGTRQLRPCRQSTSLLQHESNSYHAVSAGAFLFYYMVIIMLYRL